MVVLTSHMRMLLRMSSALYLDGLLRQCQHAEVPRHAHMLRRDTHAIRVHDRKLSLYGAASTPDHDASGHSIAGASSVRVVAVQIFLSAALFSQIGADPATAITRDSCIGEQELGAPGGLTQCTVRDVEFHGMHNARVQQPSRHTVGKRRSVHVRACGALSPFELFRTRRRG